MRSMRSVEIVLANPTEVERQHDRVAFEQHERVFGRARSHDELTDAELRAADAGHVLQREQCVAACAGNTPDLFGRDFATADLTRRRAAVHRDALFGGRARGAWR